MSVFLVYEFNANDPAINKVSNILREVLRNYYRLNTTYPSAWRLQKEYTGSTQILYKYTGAWRKTFSKKKRKRKKREINVLSIL